MRVFFAVLAVGLLATCSSGMMQAKCSAETCAGCCSAEGICQEGQVGDLVTMCRIDEPRLALVTPSVGTLSPKWSLEKIQYNLSVPASVTSVTLTPLVTPAFGFPLKFEGADFTSGMATPEIAIPLGYETKRVTFSVVGRYHPEKGKTYTISLSRGLGFADDVPAQGKQFGVNIARSGDTLVVAAKEGLHVFRQSGTTWTYEAMIPPEIGESLTSFTISGNSVAISLRDQVRVMTRVGSTWTKEATIEPPGPHTDSWIGAFIEGDTIVMGSPNEASAARTINGDFTDTTAPGAGAVWVYTRTGTTWTQQAYLKASNADVFDRFGSSVWLKGDTLLVSARQEDSGLTDSLADNTRVDSGAVYVFTRTGTTWAQTGYLKEADPEAGAQFGAQLAAVDGLVAVGSGGVGSLRVGLYTGSGTSWTQVAHFQGGASLALTSTMLAIGNPGDDRAGSGINPASEPGAPGVGSGIVSFYRYTGSSWDFLGEAKPPVNPTGAGLGGVLVAGPHEFYVSALGENAGAGAVHVVTVP